MENQITIMKDHNVDLEMLKTEKMELESRVTTNSSTAVRLTQIERDLRNKIEEL
jgi:hypothetical protein